MFDEILMKKKDGKKIGFDVRKIQSLVYSYYAFSDALYAANSAESDNGKSLIRYQNPRTCIYSMLCGVSHNGIQKKR